MEANGDNSELKGSERLRLEANPPSVPCHAFTCQPEMVSCESIGHVG